MKDRALVTSTRLNFRGVRAGTWIARAPVMAAALLGFVPGCGANDDAQAAAEADESEIFGGVRDDDALAKPGVVALRVGDLDICSGAVLAPNVVLTAKHCVVKKVSTSVVCDEHGVSKNGPHVASPEEPKNIGIYLGASPSFSRSPVARAKAVFAADGDTFCDSDIALVVLDRPLAGIEPFAVRVRTNAKVGETIRAVGYGKNDSRVPMGTRFRKEKVPVLAVGKGVSKSRTKLGAREFEVGKSICAGDSGGPAISELTGAVIGVVSRGGPCAEDWGHVYTATTGFDVLFARAFAVAGANPLVEANGPEPSDEAEAQAESSVGDPAGGHATAAEARDACAVTTPSRAPIGAAAAALVLAAGTLARRRLRGRRAHRPGDPR